MAAGEMAPAPRLKGTDKPPARAPGTAVRTRDADAAISGDMGAIATAVYGALGTGPAR
ncbi:hypothetical protein [Streptomyces parvus]|uniref:hypothetical protein n=1 Tax=Streptomyces parvus TaxID=66428 RepID=UPI00370FEBCC